MELYQTVTVESFIKSCESLKENNHFSFPAFNLMHIFREEDYMYGLSLLRRAIYLYEKEHGIPEKESKEDMPFFRENSRVLVGPEIGLFILPMQEKPNEYQPGIMSPALTITWDYKKLAEYCLFENVYLLKCKYNEDQAVETFKNQLEKEYDKFFFDEENSGFTRDSRFFSMLCNACLEVVDPSRSGEQEWRMTVLKPYAEANYVYDSDTLFPYIPLNIPGECLKRLALVNATANPLLYGTLSGFMKSVGLPPEVYLEGMLEE